MQRPAKSRIRSAAFLSPFALAFLLALSGANAVELEVLHADSLAGPMRALKGAFEAKNPGVTLKFTPGVSRNLAERILKGEACDVFASSSPAVIDEDMMNKRIAGSERRPRPGTSCFPPTKW